MKRFIAILILMVAAIVLCGCTSYSANKFNDLKVEEALSNKEKTKLLEEIEKTFVEFSKVTISSESFEKQGQTDNVEKVEITFKAYSNYLVVGSGKYDVKENEEGISFQQSEKIEMSIWASDENKAILLYSKDGDDEDYSFYSSFTEENASTKKNDVYLFVYNYLENMSDEFENLKAYKLKNGGYMLAASEKNESYNAVAWGNETKERYNLQESQIIVIIDKDYHITGITVYSSKSTNRDPDTGEWYSKTKKVEGTSVSIEISYGSRKEDSSKVSSLNNSYKDSNKSSTDE